MAGHLNDRLAAGGHSPGVFLIRSGSTIRSVVEFLEAAAHASDPSEWQDQVTYI
jgi:hypothetical protein